MMVPLFNQYFRLICDLLPGSKSQKHVLRPESLEGSDEEDPITALEWDPLSTDYLLGRTPGACCTLYFTLFLG